MKFQIAYYLLILYTVLMFKPVMPFIGDVLSHTFAEAIHESTVHAKYGNNHLQKELAAEGSENNSDKNQNIQKSESQIVVHVISNNCTYDFSVNKSSTNFSAVLLCNLPDIFIAKQIPPPKFSV